MPYNIHYFFQGSESPKTFRRPTEITPKWMNTVQEELASIVLYQDGVLDTNNNSQVLEKIISLIQSVGNDHFINRIDTTDDDKWALFPKGHLHPFIPSIMGSALAPWLIAHPDWAILDDTVISGIQGRVLAIASTTHVAGTMAGSNDAVVVLHGHGITDPSHHHDVTVSNQGALADSTSGGDLKPTTQQSELTTHSSVTGITINNFGVDGTGKNIQPTFYVTWIYKKV